MAAAAVGTVAAKAAAAVETVAEAAVAEVDLAVANCDDGSPQPLHCRSAAPRALDGPRVPLATVDRPEGSAHRAATAVAVVELAAAVAVAAFPLAESRAVPAAASSGLARTED